MTGDPVRKAGDNTGLRKVFKHPLQGHTIPGSVLFKLRCLELYTLIQRRQEDDDDADQVLYEAQSEWFKMNLTTNLINSPVAKTEPH
ncbi:hypothetical protein EVAR_3585_1 [Eumeta japonica]|uniref:Uncharacterized protein n=1 Tax=Eumeta variegata TaxID=151549 RepID=A0A4C1SY88_EUMVA|nr:hypothetical protein EVAR_3585_1 [Eumeta japonica]